VQDAKSKLAKTNPTKTRLYILFSLSFFCIDFSFFLRKPDVQYSASPPGDKIPKNMARKLKEPAAFLVVELFERKIKI
jgi:hypothetical protein